MMKKILLTFTFATLANGLVAGDWTGFRGPLGNGVSDEVGLPVALDAKKHIAWRIDLPGRGLSSPLVVGARVFVTASGGTRQDRLQILCLNAADGSVIWQRQFWAMGSTMCHDKTSIAAPTPVTDGRRLFAIFSSNDLFCLDLDGNLEWLRGLTFDYPNARNSLGMASSLVIAGGVLVAQVENDSESFTAGLSKQDGVNLWKIDRPKSANWTTAMVQKTKSGREWVLLQSGKGIHAVNPKSGEVAWHYAEGASTIPSSTLADGVLYVPSHGGTALELAADSGKGGAHRDCAPLRLVCSCIAIGCTVSIAPVCWAAVMRPAASGFGSCGSMGLSAARPQWRTTTCTPSTRRERCR